MNEIEEIDDIHGVVRVQSQETIERQAAEHLELLTKRLQDNEQHDDDDQSSVQTKRQTFSVETFIKQQVTCANEPLTGRANETPRTCSQRRYNQNIYVFTFKSEKTNKPIDFRARNQVRSEYVPSDDETEPTTSTKRPRTRLKGLKSPTKDDGAIATFKKRLKSITNDSHGFKSLDYDVKIARRIWSRLYTYQKVGVKWLNELNRQTIGGLLGDEMGLGKTVQIIAYLAALKASKQVSKFGAYSGLGPVLIACPATVLYQWVQHFHEWLPESRVVVLHQSGTFKGTPTQLIRDVNKSHEILITTYQSVLKHEKLLRDMQWHYVILDEGHKIRNPTAKITACVKHLRTPHRILLTGSPMQNNLTELWSLFDFITPGKLGTLPVFTDHFAAPIMHGAYETATPMQEQTALSIAQALKHMITPYMLRRVKANVAIDLPGKDEHVLFCRMTDVQKQMYKDVLTSDDVRALLDRGKSVFVHRTSRACVFKAITHLRKICNHPHLYEEQTDFDALEASVARESLPDTYGYYKLSGKMLVLTTLLRIWHKQGHRALIFTQSRAMLRVFELYVTMLNYTYVKMDGGTSVAQRQSLIDRFNDDPTIFIFLLTTRVGGLGVNLTGANRVVIFDPDWNPATDTQARERAWRIGQRKSVAIYRLLAAGTIEKKIYQRQIWKNLLSNRILVDPRQARVFKTSDLFDLFSLQETCTDENNETGNIFRDCRINVKQPKKKRKVEPKPITQIESPQVNPRPKPTLAPNEVWDPNQSRYKHPQKLVFPVVELQTNRLDELETNETFERVIERLDCKRKRDESGHREEVKDVEVVRTTKNVKVDYSGVMDGEKIDGLVRREKTKRKKEPKETHRDINDDNYVLEKLFTKGVSCALKHDQILNNDQRADVNSLKIKTEAQRKADAALDALKKSRLRDWRW